MGVLHTSSACLWLLWILPRGGIPVSECEEAAQKVTGKQNWRGEVPTLFITSLVAETKIFGRIDSKQEDFILA